MKTPTPTAEQGPTVSDIPGTPEFAEKHPITSKAHLQFMLWVLKDAAVTTEQKLAYMLQKPANGWQLSAALERRNAELAEALEAMNVRMTWAVNRFENYITRPQKDEILNEIGTATAALASAKEAK